MTTTVKLMIVVVVDCGGGGGHRVAVRVGWIALGDSSPHSSVFLSWHFLANPSHYHAGMHLGPRTLCTDPETQNRFGYDTLES